MTNCQDTHLIPRCHEPIQGHVASFPVGNDQLPQFAFESAANKRMCAKIVDGRLNRRHCLQRCRWILVTQELKRTLDLLERPCRINYLRHDFGRVADSPTASRFIQAYTSSAR